MKLKDTVVLAYRKYPFLRLGTLVFIVAIVLGALSFFSKHAKHPPVITLITPPVGAAGDIMTITGSDFGFQRRPESYVEVGGSKITSSGYLSWSDSQIRVILPTNVQDGLVLVGTKSGVSKPGFFANEADIPVAVPTDTKTTQPVIASVTPSASSPGSLVTISGSNFGTIRGASAVFFTANRDDNDSVTSTFDTAYIPASEANFDYEYWSDSELHVRIPDGAAAGALYVRTEKGESNHAQLQVRSAVGSKSYTERKTYILRLSADIENMRPKDSTSITVRMPRPPVFAQQPMAELTECAPAPLIESYRNMTIHQVEFTKYTSPKARISEDFAVSVYTLTTSINERAVKPFSEKSRVLYTAATGRDALIQTTDSSVTSLAAEIVKRETNPYRAARLIYNYLLDTYKLTEAPVRRRSSPLELITKKKGDAYDFAVVFTTLARAAGIPALPVSGILVDADLNASDHWWSEIYLEHFGWVPVDPALGAGLPYKAFKQTDDPRAYYFGNLDSQHVAFSRGWNEVKPSFINSKTVYRDRTYALQSIWEESSGDNVNYSSLWNDPVVAGIY